MKRERHPHYGILISGIIIAAITLFAIVVFYTRSIYLQLGNERPEALKTQINTDYNSEFVEASNAGILRIETEEQTESQSTLTYQESITLPTFSYITSGWETVLIENDESPSVIEELFLDTENISTKNPIAIQMRSYIKTNLLGDSELLYGDVFFESLLSSSGFNVFSDQKTVAGGLLTTITGVVENEEREWIIFETASHAVEVSYRASRGTEGETQWFETVKPSLNFSRIPSL
ncbi:MAG: hypothetical protein O3B96_00245 [bacterium]|nr:hypothetical protein [bacterium]